jgi:hypothetical protein
MSASAKGPDKAAFLVPIGALLKMFIIVYVMVNTWKYLFMDR